MDFSQMETSLAEIIDSYMVVYLIHSWLNIEQHDNNEKCVVVVVFGGLGSFSFILALERESSSIFRKQWKKNLTTYDRTHQDNGGWNAYTYVSIQQ